MSATPPDSLVAALAGRYEVDREIGRGGMARVYLARDLRHDRRVALKVLNAELGAVLGVERFLAEIKVTANLQHPNLLPLFDSGEAAGQLFYVMPFVDGGTLRARLDRETQLPVEEAVRITTGVANALAWAHERGVIHRDLKPANILLQDGEPVVADFGIALAVSRAGGERLTLTGMSLGTPHYMSPEQATGERAVDARADQYSLGATMYEMLAGEPPHTGATAQAVLARVLTEPHRSIRVSRPAVPAHVERAIDRALQKLPVDRFATIRDFAAALKGDGGAAGLPSRRARWPRAPVAAMVTAAIALAGVALWLVPRWSASDEPLTRTPLAFEGDAKFVSRGGVSVALNADGTQLVYNGGADASRLYLKRRGDAAPVRLVGGENGFSPVFTPDERWIAFVSVASGGTLRKVPVSGGIPILIADSTVRFSWGDGDVVVVTRPNGSLGRVGPDGGPVETIVAPDASRGETFYSWPHVLPGGKAVLFNVSLGQSPDSFEVAAVRLADRQVVRFGLHCVNPRYVAAGYLLCARLNGTVIAAPFDLAALRVTGAAEQVIDNVEVRGQGAAAFAVSRNGTLVSYARATTRQLVSVDIAGRASVLLGDQPGVAHPRVSPDGKRLVFCANRSLNVSDLFVFELGTRLLTQFTHDGRSCFAAWSPDGRRLIWYSRRAVTSAIRWQPWDGSEPEATLADSAFGVTVARRGNYLITQSSSLPEERGWRTVSLDSPRVTPFKHPAGTVELFVVSPDGNWLAGQSILSGRPEVFVEPIPSTGARHQISLGGGVEPVWAPNGLKLYYSARGSLWAATLAAAPAFKIVRRDSLFTLDLPPSSPMANYDLMPDGKSFVAVRDVGGDAPPVMVTGWFAELRRRMARAAP